MGEENVQSCTSSTIPATQVSVKSGAVITSDSRDQAISDATDTTSERPTPSVRTGQVALSSATVPPEPPEPQVGANLNGDTGPRVELVDASTNGGTEVRVTVSLPDGVASAQDLELDVSSNHIVIRVRATALILSDADLPCAVDPDSTRAKLSRKRRTISLTMTPVE